MALVAGIEVKARWPRMVVYVRGGRCNLEHWRRVAARLSINHEHTTEDGKPVPVQVLKRDDGLSGRLVAYVVYGLPAALKQLQDSPPGCLASWHYVMDTPVPRFATGCGEAKAPSKAAKPKPRTSVENELNLKGRFA